MVNLHLSRIYHCHTYENVKCMDLCFSFFFLCVCRVHCEKRSERRENDLKRYCKWVATTKYFLSLNEKNKNNRKKTVHSVSLFFQCGVFHVGNLLFERWKYCGIQTDSSIFVSFNTLNVIKLCLKKNDAKARKDHITCRLFCILICIDSSFFVRCVGRKF